jgi:hypothetical protein
MRPLLNTYPCIHRMLPGAVQPAGQRQASPGSSKIQRVGTGSLFFLEGPNGATYFPAFFADEKYEKRALRRVARALEGQSGANKWLFFTSPSVSLGGLTPLEILAGKKPGARAGFNAEERERIGMDSVLKAAAAFSEE